MWKRNNKVISRNIDGEGVIIDSRKGRFYVLNPVGQIIWECLESPIDIRRLIAFIKERCFSIPSEDILKRDISSFLATLKREELVREIKNISENTSIKPKAVDAIEYASPQVKYTDKLQAAAGVCDSGHSGGNYCRTAFPCIQLFS